MDLGKGTGGTTARSFRRPPTEMVRKAAIQGKARVGIALDETKEEGWKERKSTKGKPEFLVLLTADYQSDLHRETKINFRNGKS